ncbi:MAG: hypothetical protein KatS3mg105_3770 [Gemmatales bacterium]|nr:MAG: hypothetical protein KatS3mg105_3770 [Gemmatales bacterium]
MNNTRQYTTPVKPPNRLFQRAAKVVDLNGIIRETEKMLRRLIGEDIELTLTLADNLKPVYVDRTQIEQVIINLAVNARDAMPQGGRLTIETRNVQIDEEYARSHRDLSAGPHVLLSVTDSGEGIREEDLDKLFEPFFTTKPAGKGTGLGLAVVDGIVRQSGGAIEVYSEVGVGTTFKIYFPATEEKAAGATNEREKPRALPRGTETILLAEDEAKVRAYASLILKQHGYTVLEAASGKKALEFADAYSGKIDLLLTDVVMPEMSGRELADALKQKHPHLKVLYISGFPADAIVRHGIIEREVSFLSKPFNSQTLLTKIRELLD